MKRPDISSAYLQNLLQETESALRSAKQELSELRRGLDAAVTISVSNVRGEITYVNPLFCKFTGYSQEEILGKTHRMFKSGHHPRSFYKEMWDTLMRGQIWKGEVMNKRKDGSFYWMDTTIVPFADAGGVIYQFMSFRKDITQRKVAQEREEKERAAREYAGRLVAVGEMASNIAHEIRNPLGAILMRAQLTRDEMDPTSDGAKALDQIERLVNRIVKIIDGVRSLSRDGGDNPHEEVHLATLIRESLEVVRLNARASEAQFLLDDIDPALRVHCRPVQISQVLVNLMGNALDAVHEAHEKWIRISVRVLNSKIQIRVSDAGAGVPAELRDQIMRPYFTTKPVGKGTGLGLSVSREIVRNHGGELTLDETEQHTTFVIELPR